MRKLFGSVIIVVIALRRPRGSDSHPVTLRMPALRSHQRLPAVHASRWRQLLQVPELRADSWV